jgi:hypothetical protein
MGVIAEEATEPVVETTEAAPEVEVVETTEEAPVVETEEVAVETKEDEPIETVTDTVTVLDFDDPDVNTKITEVVDKYELPSDVQAVINFYKERAEQPAQDFQAYAEYGDADAIKTLLDRQALLDSVTETDAGAQRPSTDKFVQTLNPEKAGWLFFDTAKLPSQKYQGLTLFEEALADNFAQEGDTVGSVLARYQENIQALQSGNVIATSVPEYIPTQFHEAYWSLPKAERDALEMYDPRTDRIETDETTGRMTNVDEPIRNDKLRLLQQIQKGIDGEKFIKRQEVQSREERQSSFNNGVIETQDKFYDTIRQTFTEDMLKAVTFSTDPKMQTILAHQNVALLTQAFSEESDGVFARNALKEAGINFDYQKAQQLMKDVEQASITLEMAKQVKDASGNPINQIELNKAKATFERAGKNWQVFAKDILEQEARLTSTGTTKAVDEAAEKKIEKKKLEVKARPSTKGVSDAVKNTSSDTSPPKGVRYGTPEWDGWFADRQMEREAARAAKYA